MANTLYRSIVPVTRQNQRAAFAALNSLFAHAETWDLSIVQIARPTTGVNTGHIVVTLNNPIPAGQEAHVQVTGPI